MPSYINISHVTYISTKTKVVHLSGPTVDETTSAPPGMNHKKHLENNGMNSQPQLLSRISSISPINPEDQLDPCMVAIFGPTSWIHQGHRDSRIRRRLKLVYWCIIPMVG